MTGQSIGGAQHQRVTAISGLAVAVAVAVAFTTLAALAAISDSHAIGARPSSTVLDVAVGFAFAVAAGLTAAPRRQRLLILVIGAAWLAGSSFAAMRTAHQALLLVALSLYPTGRTREVPRLLLAAAGLPIALQVLPQLAVAGLFALLAITILLRDRRGAATTAYPVAAALVLAGALVFAWWTAHRGEVGSALAVYEWCLLAIAAGYPFANHVLEQHRSGLADRVLHEAQSAGLPGLQRVLAAAVADPGLRIECWDPASADYAAVDREISSALAGAEPVLITDGGVPLARVLTTSRAVTDRATADAVIEAVRLAVLNDHLYAELDDRGAELARSRRRLLAATDNERERVFGVLSQEVRTLLDRALGSLTTAASHEPNAGMVEVSVAEVAAARDDVEQIVAGAPPVPLGQGQLAGGLRVLAARSPLPVTLSLDDSACAGVEAETALFYVCSEALTNAVKHSRAQSATVRLTIRGDALELSVRDDGAGGANAAGAGLLGLADRLAAVDGSLAIDSVRGTGTTITACIPIRS